MTEATASTVVWLVTTYLGVGLVFAIPFVIWGVGRLDPAAKAGTPGFRLLIIPGVAVWWPLFLARWLAGWTAPPSQRTAHQPPHARSRKPS